MRDFITFEVEGVGKFDVYAEPTFLEEKQVEKLVSGMYGGVIAYEQFKYGTDNLANAIAPDIEQGLLIERGYDLAVILACRENLRTARTYAVIKVCGVEIPNKFEEINLKDMEKVVSAFEVALTSFFRKVEQGSIKEPS